MDYERSRAGIANRQPCVKVPHTIDRDRALDAAVIRMVVTNESAVIGDLDAGGDGERASVACNKAARAAAAGQRECAIAPLEGCSRAGRAEMRRLPGLRCEEDWGVEVASGEEQNRVHPRFRPAVAGRQVVLVKKASFQHSMVFCDGPHTMERTPDETTTYYLGSCSFGKIAGRSS
jgi:hypothetical protein